ncbi:MAG: phosphatidate cytidylyltransferase [Armatimonadetes bacterium]|nr:phosphatidate cytidylyltransferase [Armatimonadota bacterium]MDW8120904.1 phosphatidate cytidylyltransferase [Armatimonadota bacterium]
MDRQLGLRVGTAFFGLLVFVGVAVWGFFPFLILVWFLAVFSALELLLVLQRGGKRVSWILGFSGVVGVAAPFFLIPFARRVLGAVGALFFLAGLLYELAHCWIYREMKTAERIAYGLLCGVYVSLFGGVTVLRAGIGFAHGPLPPLDESPGLALLLIVCACVWMADAAAYFAGFQIGRTPLAPHISPGKTVEGAVVAFATSLVVGMGLGAVLFKNLAVGITVGILSGIFGWAGDLLESAMKRSLGIKDFSALLPGHGGILDRFDSLLLAAPVNALVLWLWKPL